VLQDLKAYSELKTLLFYFITKHIASINSDLCNTSMFKVYFFNLTPRAEILNIVVLKNKIRLNLFKMIFYLTN